MPAPTEKARTELLLEKIEALCLAGVDWVQIREKDISGKACSTLTREALRRISPGTVPAQPTTRVIVNDRLDVALAVRAGGAHLGEEALPMAEAKGLVRAFSHAYPLDGEFLLGVSCHSLDSARAAAAAGADYIFFGPVFATPSKAAYGAPQGLAALHGVCASVAIPVLAIGGVTVENASSCLTAGASGIAAIRLFQDARDPAALVRSLFQSQE